jgi:hypothetical protein
MVNSAVVWTFIILSSLVSARPFHHSPLDEGEYTASQFGRIKPLERACGIYCIRGSIDLRTYLNAVNKVNSLCRCQKSNTDSSVLQPLYYLQHRLSYHDPFQLQANGTWYSRAVIHPCTNHDQALGAPVLPTRWVKISIYLQLKLFISIIIILIKLKFLILFFHNPNSNVLCYVFLITSHLRLFVYFSALICFPPVLACNLSLTLYSACPYSNYLYLHCAVSVIGLVAVDSAHK